MQQMRSRGPYQLGHLLCRDEWYSKHGECALEQYKGSLQTGLSEDENGKRKWAAIKKSIAAFDPALSARDDKEESARGNLDHRFNHWTAARDGLVNAHADVFPRIPAIVKALPNPIDQMKVFELIQIIPSPTKSALNSGSFSQLQNFRPHDLGFLRNNSIFTFGQVDRAKTSASFREILDAMWLFDSKLSERCPNFRRSNFKRGTENRP